MHSRFHVDLQFAQRFGQDHRTKIFGKNCICNFRKRDAERELKGSLFGVGDMRSRRAMRLLLALVRKATKVFISGQKQLNYKGPFYNPSDSTTFVGS